MLLTMKASLLIDFLLVQERLEMGKNLTFLGGLGGDVKGHGNLRT